MTASITSDSVSITISGNYKEFVSSASSKNVIQFASGDAPANSDGDAGRFLQWRKDPFQSDTWETRFILNSSSTDVDVGDGGFSSAPSAGEIFVISTKLSDIVSATTSCTVQGKQFSFNGRDWNLTNGAFLADVNISLDMSSVNSTAYSMTNGTSVQFGRLSGGEANESTETTEGCHLIFSSTRTSTGSIYKSTNSRSATGPVINYYGCLVESNTNNSGDWRFQRMAGPTRFIGCVFDGPMGGRFYHEASEWVQCRMSGNDNTTVSWSLGATFTRDISSVLFYEGLIALKNFQGFSGTIRDTKFSSSMNRVLLVGASSTSVFNFIDCTTFADSDLVDNGDGVLNQFKSVNYVITDSNGLGLSDVKVAIYDNVGDIQGSIQTSASGVLAEILTKFYIFTNNSPSVNRAPFDIRLRKYGLVYQGFQSAVSESIKQELRLRINNQLVSNEAEASAISGISLNFSTKTLTITEDTNTQALYDYYQYQLAQTVNMQYEESFSKSGILFDIDDWDMVVDASTYTGDIVTTGLVTIVNSGVFNGTRTDANGTVTPSAFFTVKVNQTGADVVILEAGTQTVLASVDAQAGTNFIYEYNGSDVVDIGVIKQGFKVSYSYSVELSGTNSTLPINLLVDRDYQ